MFFLRQSLNELDRMQKSTGHQKDREKHDKSMVCFIHKIIFTNENSYHTVLQQKLNFRFYGLFSV